MQKHRVKSRVEAERIIIQVSPVRDETGLNQSGHYRNAHKYVTSSYNLVVESLGHDDHLDLSSKGDHH